MFISGAERLWQSEIRFAKARSRCSSLWDLCELHQLELHSPRMPFHSVDSMPGLPVNTGWLVDTIR